MARVAAETFRLVLQGLLPRPGLRSTLREAVVAEIEPAVDRLDIRVEVDSFSFTSCTTPLPDVVEHRIRDILARWRAPVPPVTHFDLNGNYCGRAGGYNRLDVATVDCPDCLRKIITEAGGKPPVAF